jgi:hypothetical protein
MSIKSKFTVTKFRNGVVYIAGEPKFVGKLPPPSTAEQLANDSELQDLWHAMETVLRAGDENN